LAPGRSGTCVKSWLDEQTEQFRARIEIVVIDPFRPYASGVRKALPEGVSDGLCKGSVLSKGP
ncbi:MAG: transposase, partial [Candidatus Limnocylindria bacterium]